MTPRDRRALVIGGAAVLAAVLVLRVLPWGVRETVAAHAALTDRAALLARAREELAAAPQLRDSAAALTRAVVALAPRVLSGGRAEEAGADLAGRINLAASRAPARLDRVEALTDSGVAGRLRRARARAWLETDVRGLAGLLRRLEGDEAVLTIERLAVTAADPTSGDRAPEVLRVEVTVSGWFLESREPGALKDSLPLVGSREP